jgi:hypothetical protein
VVVVFIQEEQIYGTVDKLGAFVSNVKYQKDGIDYEVVLENEEFTILDEIVFEHIEEDV